MRLQQHAATNMATVIDLFSGAGGLSLGAARAGFDVRGSVEIDQFALEVHKRNFPSTRHLAVDVSGLSGGTLLTEVGVRPGELTGLIGGPPCQGFSTMGRRDESDARNNLFGHFFRLVAELRPAFFVAENVPGILDSRYDHVRSKALKSIPDGYRVLDPLRLSANSFGVPTTRTRIFFIGYDPLRFRTDLETEMFAPPTETLVTTVGHALIGLPEQIDCSWQSEEQGWRPVSAGPLDWFFERVTNSVPHTVGDPPALERFFEKGQVSGCMGTRHTAEVVERFSNTVPGKVDPISKAIRLKHDGFCPTLRAGTSKEKGSYQAVRPIHYAQPRVITPREAARLQGFPDWFTFHSTKWHSFRQIGNSVSPLIAEFVLGTISRAL